MCCKPVYIFIYRYRGTQRALSHSQERKIKKIIDLAQN